MKVLLVCAGGMSTSMLVKKLKKYAEAKNIPLEAMEAYGIGDYEEVCNDYDVILLGPQVSYRKDSVQEAVNMPVGVIAPFDYAMSNEENIFKQIDELLEK